MPSTIGGVSAALGQRLRSLTKVRSAPEGALFLAATTGTEIAKAIGPHRLELVCKPLIAPAALACALRGGRLGGADSALIGAAAAAYTAGDVVLMLGGGHAERQSSRLVRGGVAFGLGHLALGAALVRSGARMQPAVLLPHAIAAAVTAAKLATSSDRGMRPLAGYAIGLSGLSALATSAGLSSRTPDSVTVLAVGGPLFLLSDLLILVRRAMPAGSARARLADVAVIDTYALAVLLLLSGTAELARSSRRA